MMTIREPMNIPHRRPNVSLTGPVKKTAATEPMLYMAKTSNISVLLLFAPVEEEGPTEASAGTSNCHMEVILVGLHAVESAHQRSIVAVQAPC